MGGFYRSSMGGIKLFRFVIVAPANYSTVLSMVRREVELELGSIHDDPMFQDNPGCLLHIDSQRLPTIADHPLVFSIPTQ